MARTGPKRQRKNKLDKEYQKYFESFEIWCLRKAGDISRIDHVKNEKILQRIKEKINIIKTEK
jgi:hypothetical protein